MHDTPNFVHGNLPMTFLYSTNSNNNTRYSRYRLRLVHFIERTYLISGNGTPSPRNDSSAMLDDVGNLREITEIGIYHMKFVATGNVAVWHTACVNALDLT